MKFKKIVFNYIISILLLLSLVLTGSTGYIQANLDLRRFVPHRYFAYTTLILSTVHLYINLPRIYSYLKRRIKDE